MEPVKSRCVCTSLRMATRSIARLYDRGLAEFGLRAVGYAILARLEEDGPLTLGHLASSLALERTTCSRELSPLVDAGLVEITVGEDRRRRIVRLTQAGAERFALAYPHWESVQADVAREFGPAETKELLTALHRVTVAAQSLAGSPGAQA
jgi:DNA-binding MarR family transcriptional regulator